MKLQNGFELEGNININPIYLNNKWSEILIIESTLEIDKLRELFKDNNIIINVNKDIETTYFTKGLIDVKSQDNKNYVWLYFDYLNENNTNQEFKSQLADVLRSDLNFKTVKFLYTINQITKENVFECVKSGKITQVDYLTIIGESCPELSLDVVKQLKIKELDKECNKRIYFEFYSSADGISKLYDFDTDHQTRILAKKFEIMFIKGQGQIAPSISYYAKGGDCHDYTPEQFLQLAMDGENWLTLNTTKYKEFKKYIPILTTVDEINSVTFDTIIPTV